MSGIMTGPLSNGSYEALAQEHLDGNQLLNTRGEMGLAVDYGDSAFRFRGDITRVIPCTDVNMVCMDVVSLDGNYFHELTLEADAGSGIIWERSLQFRPMTNIGDAKPKSAFIYDEETAAEILGDETVGGRDLKMFQQLEADQRSQLARRSIAFASGLAVGMSVVRIPSPRD